MKTFSATSNCLGDNLKLLRTLHQRSQDDVAKELHMSRSNYVYIETGVHDTRPDDVIMLEKMTQMSVDTLMHVNMRMQLLQYLDVLSRSIDDKSFVDGYVMLSARGRGRIAQYIDQLSRDEL